MAIWWSKPAEGQAGDVLFFILAFELQIKTNLSLLTGLYKRHLESDSTEVSYKDHLRLLTVECLRNLMLRMLVSLFNRLANSRFNCSRTSCAVWTSRSSIKVTIQNVQLLILYLKRQKHVLQRKWVQGLSVCSASGFAQTSLSHFDFIKLILPRAVILDQGALASRCVTRSF